MKPNRGSSIVRAGWKSTYELPPGLNRIKITFGSIFALFFIFFLFDGCTGPFTQGKALYEANCSRCHGSDGQGFENLYPGIRESPYLHEKNLNLACVIVYGSTFLDQNSHKSADPLMPENKHLTSVEVLNIVNYLSWEFGKQTQHTIESVMRNLEKCEP
ncbi:cytochrome c [Membranicola marinus]|uniref:Cytochrome c n=1 Tax=Membranihabitans marinus TaxID=1227546 RepID=A0A953L7T7_9BACT|nr:cytochrome c [Membranihabitans marinus]MBY5959052.1 cytochrome c [Membranihabitans marinus]